MSILSTINQYFAERFTLDCSLLDGMLQAIGGLGHCGIPEAPIFVRSKSD